MIRFLAVAPKLLRLGLFSLIALTTLPALAQEEESAQKGTTHPNISLQGNIAITSDYRFRGISQTSRQIAVQGGFDIVPSDKWFVGLWVSSLDGASNAETDVYGGFGGEIKNGFSYDVRFIYYHYPETKDYWEVSSSISKAGYIKAGKEKNKTINTNLTLGLVASHNYFASTGGFLYPNLTFSFDLAEHVSMDLHFGFNYFTRSNPGFFTDSTRSYSDWSIGVTTEAINNAFWTVAIVGTDVNDETCGGPNLCAPKLVLTLAKTL